jgi:SRSO17 transposase
MAKKVEPAGPSVEPLSFSESELRAVLQEVREYHAIFAPLYARREQREWGEFYLQGLVSPDIERKSIEPMVLARKGANINWVRAVQQFVGAGAWDDGPLLQQHRREVQVTLGEQDGVVTLDGSDFPKQGKESVGTKRQHCGELGKTANCQAGVFLGYVSRRGYTLLDRRLYLPKEWVASPEYKERREKCGIPKDIVFRTKNELAGEMVEALVAEGALTCRWVTCDEAFGCDTALLDRIAAVGLWYFAEVPENTRVWTERPIAQVALWCGRGRKPQRPVVPEGQPSPRLVSEIAQVLSMRSWSRHSIKEGSKGPILADFAVLRVIGVREALPGPDVWLILRRNLETREVKYYLCNAPAETLLGELVRISGLRWPIETCFEEGKQHLGMGDYEVRSWAGWHHHMTLCLLAHHLIVRVQLKLKKNTSIHSAPGGPSPVRPLAEAAVRSGVGHRGHRLPPGPQPCCPQGASPTAA